MLRLRRADESLVVLVERIGTEAGSHGAGQVAVLRASRRACADRRCGATGAEHRSTERLDRRGRPAGRQHARARRLRPNQEPSRGSSESAEDGGARRAALARTTTELDEDDGPLRGTRRPASRSSARVVLAHLATAANRTGRRAEHTIARAGARGRGGRCACHRAAGRRSRAVRRRCQQWPADRTPIMSVVAGLTFGAGLICAFAAGLVPRVRMAPRNHRGRALRVDRRDPGIARHVCLPCGPVPSGQRVLAGLLSLNVTGSWEIRTLWSPVGPGVRELGPSDEGVATSGDGMASPIGGNEQRGGAVLVWSRGCTPIGVRATFVSGRRRLPCRGWAANRRSRPPRAEPRRAVDRLRWPTPRQTGP